MAFGSPALADDAPRYPRAVIARPLTLPAHLASLGADAASNADLTAIGASPVAGYGFTDELELQVVYGFGVHELEGRGSVALDAGYALVRGALDGKLEVIARARAGYDTLAMESAGAVGLHVQYNVMPWLAVISGAPGSEQLRFTSSSVEAIAPLGIGVQPASTLYLQLDTNVANTAVPLALTVVWNVADPVDVQAAVASEVAGDAMSELAFLVGARFYAGRL